MSAEKDGEFIFTGSTIRRPGCEVPPLFHLVFRKILAEIHQVPTLQGIPEEIVAALLFRVLQQGKLTNSLTQLFYHAGHAGVQEWMDKNIDTGNGVRGYQGSMSCH
eukprot:TRINITY_DN11581_c0_g1_i3.p1 TRINITY_DN11581_c0_g1~~TRINITY_DN11581_c0_g1_i3.p1  ORF type:complete len:106 (+),score=24.83 TRINITY_DN11581_c0_g1_i3:220-537(+)